MFPPSNLRGAESAVLAYVAVIAFVFALFAFGLHWLLQPYARPNPGLAAYKAPAGIEAPLGISAETTMAMERSARLAAGKVADEQEAKDKSAEQKAKRVAQKHARKPSRVASRRGFDERQPRWPWGWGYAQNSGRWF